MSLRLPARLALLVPLVLAACGDSSADPDDAAPVDAAPPDAPDYGDQKQAETRLGTTLDELTALGNKRAGSTEGAAAGDYVSQRFTAAGLSPSFESFTFLAHTVSASSLAVAIDGASSSMPHAVLAYSGSGTVDADVVYVHTGMEGDYTDKDVTGKVVMVDRDGVFHRSAQYQIVLAHGGVAMLYASKAPENAPQVGTVADTENVTSGVPAISIGMEDGAAIATALADGKTVHATLSVTGSVAPATGRNVVARLEGTGDEEAYLLVGAHYDTWFAGAVDNGSGVAALLEVAAAMAAGPKPRHDVVFVAYDGEEIALLGGYDYLRKHLVAGGEQVLAFLNFEMPAAKGGGIKAIAHSPDEDVRGPLDAAGLRDLYLLADLALVPEMFGGGIPTDIQGLYWSGVHGATTYCETATYHTPADTPDKVDVPFLARAVLRIEKALLSLDEKETTAFSDPDPSLWSATVTTSASAAGRDVTIVVHDAAGAPVPNAKITAWVDVDDFRRVHRVTATADGSGTAQLTIPTAVLTQGAGSRWLHVTASNFYPLVERVVELP